MLTKKEITQLAQILNKELIPFHKKFDVLITRLEASQKKLGASVDKLEKIQQKMDKLYDTLIILRNKQKILEAQLQTIEEYLYDLKN